MDSHTCLSLGACNPLGGQSVWASQGKLAFNSDVVIAATSMDSNALFHDLASNADGTFSGLAALLAAAQALGPTDINTFPTKVIYGVFQGEQWGRIGSRKFVDDVINFHCVNPMPASFKMNLLGEDVCLGPLKLSTAFQNISLSHVQAFISVDQVGSSTGQNFVAHATPAGASVANIITSVAANSPLGFGAMLSSSTSVPSTPLSSFLSVQPSLNGVVLSGYDASYNNKYYHSALDSRTNVNVTAITAAATILARSIYVAAGGNTTKALEINVDAQLTSDLMKCFTSNDACDLFAQYTGFSTDQLLANNGYGTLGNYVGVYNSGRQPYLQSNNGYLYTNYTAVQDANTAKAPFQIFATVVFIEEFQEDNKPKYQMGQCSSHLV